MTKKECRGKGKFYSRYTKFILFGMKISNNYSKHKVQNKTTEAFKKLLLKIAHTLLHHRISKYIKIKIKFSDQRFLVKMTCKHFTKLGNSWLSVCVRWLFSPSQDHSGSLLAVWHPEPLSCVHMAPRAWVQQLLLVLDHNFWSQYHQHPLSILHCVTTIYIHNPIDPCFGFVLLLYSSYFSPFLTCIIGHWLYEIWMLKCGLVPLTLIEVRVSWGYSMLCKIWI